MPRIYGQAPNFKDITGEKFGRLTAIERVGKNKYNYALWKCKCDCGNEVVVSGRSLRSGNTKSCGCLNLDTSTKSIVNFNTKHGESNSRLWRIWAGMLSRCESPSNKNNIYQKNGIKVCADWHSYEQFRDWANSNGYADNLTIDRIDSNKGYYPENCRWANWGLQGENKKSSKLFTVNGETHCLSYWARSIGLKKDAIASAVRGKSSEEAQSIVEAYIKRGRGYRTRRKL